MLTAHSIYDAQTINGWISGVRANVRVLVANSYGIQFKLPYANESVESNSLNTRAIVEIKM